MTRLHEAFDVLVDRGESQGADIVWARAREEVAFGPLAEMQPGGAGHRARFRVLAIAALCLAIAAAAIASAVHGGRAQPAASFPSTLECRAIVNHTHKKSALLPFVNGAHVTITIGRNVARFALVYDGKTGRGVLSAVLTGPGLTGTSMQGRFNRQEAELQHRMLKMSAATPLPVGITGASRVPNGVYGYDCGTPWVLTHENPPLGVL